MKYIERETMMAQHPGAVALAPPRSRAGRIALRVATVGFCLCIASLFTGLGPRLVGPVPFFTVTWEWWAIARATGFVGIWTALGGLVVAIAFDLQGRRITRPDPGVGVALVLCGVALALSGIAIGLLHQPPYFLRSPLEPTAGQLNALAPEAVVRAYCDSQDLWVQYWLSDSDGRAFWTGANCVPDLSLLSGASGLRVGTHTDDPSNPNDATHRSFWVSYTSHAPDSVGDPPGPQWDLVNLVRTSGGPWRVSYMGDGI